MAAARKRWQRLWGGGTRGDGPFSEREKGRKEGQEASTENTGQKKPLSEVRERCLTNDFLKISAEGKIDIV